MMVSHTAARRPARLRMSMLANARPMKMKLMALLGAMRLGPILLAKRI
jgi:hypothetical protein